MCPGIPPPKCSSGMPPPNGSRGISTGAIGSGAATTGAGAIGSGAAIVGAAGMAIAYGPPAHAASAGMLMHWGSNGPVGIANGLPWHSAVPENPAHRGSAGPVGPPGSGSSSRARAYAGAVAPAAAIPISATATAVLVAATRIFEEIPRLIHHSSRVDTDEPLRRFPVIDSSRIWSHDRRETGIVQLLTAKPANLNGRHGYR
jgi:hypothetical protein